MKTLKDFNRQVETLDEKIEKMFIQLKELEEQYEEHLKELHTKEDGKK